MLALLRTPRWIGFTVLAVVLVTGCLLLGRWQLSRAGEHTEDNSERTAAVDEQPVAPDALLAPGGSFPADAEWRRVTVSGTYDAAGTVLQRNRVRDGRAGYHVLVPLRTTQGPVLLVDRGWVPRTGAVTELTEVPAPPAGTVSVTGYLRQGSTDRGAAFTEQPQPSVGFVVAADITGEVLPGLTGREGPAYPGFLQLAEEDPAPDEAPAPAGLPDGEDPGQNYAYVVQWWVFAGIGVVGWFLLLRRESQGEVPPGGGRTRDRAADGQEDATTAAR